MSTTENKEITQDLEIEDTKPAIAIGGASGRVGGRLQFLLSGDFAVTALEHIKTVHPLENQRVVPHFEITNQDSVRRTIQQLAKTDITTFINSSGVLSIDNSEKERGDQNSSMYKVHVLGSRYLAAACYEMGISLIHLSTEYVFNGKKPAGEKYRENDLPDLGIDSNPTWYGYTKAWGERAVLEQNPDATILRISQVQSPAGGLFEATLEAFEKGEPFPRVDNQMAATITDQTVARAIAKVVKKRMDGQKLQSIYHIATIDARTPFSIATRLAESYGLLNQRRLILPETLEHLVETGQQKVLRPKNSVLDVTRFQRDFGPLPTIAQEIERYKNLYPLAS